MVEPLKDYGETGKYPYFLHRIVNKLNDGYAPIVAIIGEERSGKSEMAQKIMEHLYNDFNVLKGELDAEKMENNLAYSVVEFLEVVVENDGREGIVVDEAGAQLDSKEAMTKYNKIADKIIQTMGYKQNVYIFVLPDFRALDKRVRNKVDLKIEMKGRGKCKPQGLRKNYGKVRNTDWEVAKKPMLWYKMAKRPPKEIREAYDEKEKTFKQEHAEEMLEEIREEKKEEEEDDIPEL